MIVTLTLPLATKPEGNTRESYWVVSRRRKEEKLAVALSLRQYAPALIDQGFPMVCLMTRISFGTLDSDNLQGAFKGIRDAVAKELNINDGGADVEWRYAQRRGPRGVRAIEIKIGGKP
jgi:hypothetical protein